jgi:hypothetical protein
MMIMVKDEYLRIRKEAVVAYFKALNWCSCGETEDTWFHSKVQVFDPLTIHLLKNRFILRKLVIHYFPFRTSFRGGMYSFKSPTKCI